MKTMNEFIREFNQEYEKQSPEWKKAFNELRSAAKGMTPEQITDVMEMVKRQKAGTV